MSNNIQQDIKDFVNKCIIRFKSTTSSNAILDVEIEKIRTTVYFKIDKIPLENISFFTQDKHYYDSEVKILQSLIDMRTGKY